MISKKIFLGVIVSSLLVTASANADDLDDEWAEIDAIANENPNARVDNTPISIQEWRQQYFGEPNPNEQNDPKPPEEIENPPAEIDNPPDEPEQPPIQNPPEEIPSNDIKPIQNPPTNEQEIQQPLNQNQKPTQNPKPKDSLKDFPSYDDLFSSDNTSKKNPTYDQSDMLPPVDDGAVTNWLENYGGRTFENSRDDVFKTDEELAQEQREAEEAFKKAVKAAPYKALFSDSPYVYLLNKTSAVWKRVPYKVDEYMIDCWVCIVETDETNLDLVAVQMSDRSNINDKKYVLQHYLIRPVQQRIQFVSGFEVEGRAKNSIKERAYDPSSWEPLIPGSIEDSIYQGVVGIMGTKKAQEKGHMTFWDHLDKDLGIAIK